MPRPSQDGLEWKETLFELVPQWMRDPSIAAIENVCRQHLSIAPKDPCTVAFHTSGLFNKLYIVESASGPRMMRVSLPVYPRHKTRAEVATLCWVRENITIPVPNVFAFDDTNDTRSVSSRLHEAGRDIPGLVVGTWETGVHIQGIGTLDLRKVDQVDQGHGAEDLDKVSPGLLVSHEFFMGDHLYYDIPRGPFRSSHDWLSAVLNIIIVHQTAVLEKTDDEDEKEDAEEILPVARRLLALVPKVFPAHPDEAETTALYHHDLHLNNILVNEKGEITAVLDWESISAMPLWMATMVPKVLDEPVREEEPQLHMYMDEIPEKCNDKNKCKNELYFIHRMEWETTQLRKVYNVTLRELWPEWSLEESYVELDFFQAVSQCDGIWVKKAVRGADYLEKGQVMRFKDLWGSGLGL
ncbi:hypothetical protein QC761_0048400 [Podospora bellae-mahoneyi]|uniref:Aminoglycoside phosphotransferase domain-containing protein n=1 Tax=Podospora bellae-mahoneyi TaxID=2093777 RepID=A0ABR0FM00_9PEZI|nr:hypothetical protein QC761_0048400 [Podospora bellae-mahoneyi]